MTQTMYIGPTIRGLAKENVIYRDKIPDAVKSRAKEDKDFARLLVPMDDIMEARKEMDVTGSVLTAAYNNVLEAAQNAEKREV